MWCRCPFLAQVQLFHRGWNLTVALTGIHEQPFTLSHYYKICALINVASAAQINYFSTQLSLINQFLWHTESYLLNDSMRLERKTQFWRNIIVQCIRNIVVQYIRAGKVKWIIIFILHKFREYVNVQIWWNQIGPTGFQDRCTNF